MHEVELVLALLVALAILATLARTARVPYPIVFVVGGLLLALTPGVPDVELAPELVFLLFLPPLLYLAAFNTSIRDVRANLWPILTLAIGLVLATAAVVAVLAHALLPDLGWPAAFALGAIVSPPDAVAAMAVFRRLGVPRRMVTILEGESLFNDATALVAYQTALGASAVAFSAGQIGLRFVLVGLGGVLVGLVVGRVIAWLRESLDDTPVEITISLLTPFAAYLPAEWLGVSGVLAVVTAGLCVGRFAPRIMQPETRLRGRAVWEMVEFVLNGLVFVLIGLQLSAILPALASRSLLSLIGLGLLISLAAILVRLVWVFAAAYLSRWVGRGRRGVELSAPPQETFIVGWAGMRGIVSLATALALPLDMPERSLLLFLTFCVILVTLVGQGVSLPWLVRRLRLVGDASDGHQELHARTAASRAATVRIEQLAAEWPGHLPLIEALRAEYAHRSSHIGSHDHDGDEPEAALGEDAEQELLEHRLIRRAVIDAERSAVLDLWRREEIDDETWRSIQRDLDLEELRMEA
jgi:monovalent cation/hydrogen antiporter